MDVNEEDAQTIINVGNPSNGTAQIVNGQIQYTPNNGFTGQDSFVYVIRDAQGATDTATVTITVNGGGGNNTVIANNDGANTVKEQPVSYITAILV